MTTLDTQIYYGGHLLVNTAQADLDWLRSGDASRVPRVAVVIEDDADIRNLLEAILGQAGFTCHPTRHRRGGIEAIRTYDPILTTLDVSLPGIDGFEVARQIRSFSATYIIMLSARDEEIDTLMGLDAGADDYLTKPFRPRELRARIEAMLRRYHTRAFAGPPPNSDAGQLLDTDTPSSPPVVSVAEDRSTDEDDESGWLEHNGLRINPDMWLCDLDGAPLELTRSEFDLMLAIMQGARRVDLQGRPGSRAARRLAQAAARSATPTGGRWRSTWLTCGASSTTPSARRATSRPSEASATGWPRLSAPDRGSSGVGPGTGALAESADLGVEFARQDPVSCSCRRSTARRSRPATPASASSPTIRLLDSRLSRATWAFTWS